MSGNDNNTKLLLHLNGKNGSNYFPDSSFSNNIISSYGVIISIEQSKFCGSSAYFDGINDYLLVPDSDNWNFGNNDFTIDAQIRITSVSIGSTIGFFSQYVNIDNRGGFNYTEGSGLVFFARSGGTNTIIVIGNCSLLLNMWYHVAVVRNGTNFYLFLNGVDITSSGSSESDPYPDFSTSAKIGIWNESIYFNGYVNEFRVSKGIARWTSNFTPLQRQYGRDYSFVPFNRSYPINYSYDF